MRKKRTTKTGFRKLIQKEAIVRGQKIEDLNKEIQIKWKRAAFIPVKSFSIEEAFFTPCIYYLYAGSNIVW